jgi:hypothetical protein
VQHLTTILNFFVSFFFELLLTLLLKMSQVDENSSMNASKLNASMNMSIDLDESGEELEALITKAKTYKMEKKTHEKSVGVGKTKSFALIFLKIVLFLFFNSQFQRDRCCSSTFGAAARRSARREQTTRNTAPGDGRLAGQRKGT